MQGGERNAQHQTIQISQLVAKFGSIENFKDVMEQKSFIVINTDYITWFYVAQIMNGQKILLRTNQLRDFVIPPRLN